MRKLILLAFTILAAMLLSACEYQNELIVPYSNYDLDEYINVPDISKQAYNLPEVTVHEEEIKKVIDDFLLENASLEEQNEGVVEKGDKLRLAYTAVCEGKAISGTDNYILELGKNNANLGFEDELIGKAIGSEVKTFINVPEGYEYNLNIGGKTVEYEIKIISKIKYTLPEYTDELVQDNSEYSTTAEFEEGIKLTLANKKKEELLQNLFYEKWQHIQDNTEVKKYPEAEYMEKRNYFLEQINGLSLQEESNEDIDNAANQYAEKMVKQEMLLYYIAEKYDLIPSSKEYSEFLKKVLDRNNETEESFHDKYGITIYEYAQEKDLLSEYLLNKIKDLLFC